MPTFSRLASSNAQLPKGPRLSSLARTLVLMSAAMGLIGLTDAASTPQIDQPKNSHSSPLTPQHWQEMNLDEYLRTYPNGNVLSLSDYAEQLPHPFPLHCGIGKFKDCQIPSYASLREGPDWWIVTSTINWNYYTNFLASALSPPHNWQRMFFTTYFTISSMNTILKQAFVDRTHIPDWMAAISPLATNNNPPMDLVQTHDKVKSARSQRQSASSSGASPTDVPMIVYNSNHPVETNLRQLSTQLQQILAQSVENKVNSPISLDAGIYSAISGGRFVGPSIQTPRLASNADDIQRLIGVSAILNHQNAMIVIRKSSCSLYRKEMKDNEETRLQFCASDSTLIEIVNVKENTIVKDIYNAHLINNKYGFKTSFLASEALRCQQANQKTGHPQEPKNDDDSPFDVSLRTSDLQPTR
ncbi:hypothetical protein Pst134EA_032700 [Puccinia striiformis f. sp. tritici]|uniref:uncharacterized protein n=1 Tax=Puccinia striiformis f. sp. tritici TaxID=168172 RepID=UPI002008A1B9|nr:uncharacterized protein Pst134EA_032700 [Puccinia striiformis f. sp. tritici]KAH9443458.1 hypothetical protein Pst134EA_032700 [Puccinia striiformis f. sp. tritici]